MILGAKKPFSHIRERLLLIHKDKLLNIKSPWSLTCDSLMRY